MGALPPILVELKASSGEFMAKMGAARHEVQKLGTESSAHMQKFAAVGKAALLGIGVAAVGIGTVSVKMGMDFQAAMELIHTQAGASQVEVDKMSKAVIGLAGKTATAPTELAKGLFHLESAGFHGAKALQALKVAAEGAKVGHANLEDVTNALNATLVSGIKGAHDMSGAMGMLNATVGAGDMRMQDLADALGTGVLAGVKGFGVSLREVGAALATFGDNNIRGADAATQLRLAVQFMEKPAKSAGDALKGIGLTTSSLAKDLSHGGLTKAIADLHDHLAKAGVKANDVGRVLLDAFGKKAGVGIGLLVEQYGRFRQKLEEVHAGSSRFGEDFAATQQTMAYKVDQLKASSEALAVTIGLKLIPVVLDVAQAVMAAVGWFQKHSEVAKILGIAIGSVLVTAIGAFVVSLATATVAIGATEIALAPIALAIAGLGVGIYELVKHWDTAWAFIKRITSDVVQFIRTHMLIVAAALAFLLGPIGILIAGIVELGMHWRTVWHAIEDVVHGAWAVLRPIFEFIWNVGLLPIRIEVMLVEAAFKLAWDSIREVVHLAWTVLKPVFTLIIHSGLWVLKTEIGALGSVWEGVWGGLTAAVRGAWSVLKPIFDAIRRAVADTVGALGHVLSVASSVGGAVAKTLGGILPHFAGGVTNFGGGFALVGENGPEVVALPPGSDVYPNSTLRKSGGGAPAGGVVVNINGPVYGADSKELARKVRDALLDMRRSSGLTLGLT